MAEYTREHTVIWPQHRLKDAHLGLFFARDPSAFETARIRSSWYFDNNADAAIMRDYFLCSQSYWQQMDALLLTRA